MKKLLRLLILSISVTGLSGCDLFTFVNSGSEGETEKKEEKGIELRDYTKSVVQDASYTFDGKVFLKYVDETEKEVTSDCSFNYDTLDLSKVGSSSYFTVRYEGDKYIFNKKAYIEVTEKVTLRDITISNYSTYCKLGTTYIFNGNVDAEFSDDHHEDVTAKVSVDMNGVNTSIEGKYTVKVSYTFDKITATKSFTLSVAEHAGALSSIVASDYTNTVDKNKTYTFDGKVTANYSDNTTEVVTDRCTIGSITTTSTGVKSLSISYKDTFYNVTKSTTAKVEVIAHVENITVANPSLVVGINRSKSISVTVEPSDAKNKIINYVSANPSIATVDGNGKVTGKAVGTTTITVSSQEKPELTRTVSVEVQEIAADNWTIMLYMCGADLESGSGLATADIKEILAVTGQPDDVNILIETGGSRSWSLSSSYIVGADSIPSDQLGRWYVRNQKINKVDFLTKASMGLTSTYKSFLEWGIETYPADKYGVILWNHGGGLSGVCFDELHYNDSLTNSELKSVHSEVIGTTNKFEFIGYDACVMQNIEFGEFMSPYFNYQIGSQENESGYGWKYNNWVDDLYANKATTTILKEICDTFIASVGGDQTLSYLDLSKAAEFKTAWESYVSALKTKLESGNVSRSTFTSYIKSSVKNYDSYCQYDAKDFVTKLQSQSKYQVDSSYANAVTNLLAAGNYVGYTKKGGSAGQSNGVSVNCKRYSSSEMGFTNWYSFVSSYGA